MHGDKVVNGSDDEEKKEGLSFLQFLLIASMASGAPYGMEYLVGAGGVGLTLLLIPVLYTIIYLPNVLMSTELMTLMPSNHGQIAWSYRAFSNFDVTVFGSPLGDLLGFINASNVFLFMTVTGPWAPIIFEGYFSTITGDLSWGNEYLVKLAVILWAFIINVFKIDVVGMVLSLMLCASLTPLFIGFFWRIPDIEISQWTETCSDYDIPYLLSLIVVWGSGFGSMAALGGELNFSGTKLVAAYGSSIWTCSLILMIPIITVATFYPKCSEWYDGLIAVAYGQIWDPLYWAVMVSSLFFSAMYAVFWTAVGARFIWAMAQPSFFVMEDGSLLIDESESQELVANGTTAIARTVPIAILPEILGHTWKRTGSPMGGLVFITVVTAALCSFISFEYTTVISTYFYFAMYFFSVWAFMVMRYYEPDATRSYEIPYGKAGAWILTIGTGSVMGGIAIYMAVTKFWKSACIWIGFNVLFVIYYFTIKKMLEKRAEEDNEQTKPLLSDNNDDVAANEEVVA